MGILKWLTGIAGTLTYQAFAADGEHAWLWLIATLALLFTDLAIYVRRDMEKSGRL